MTARPTASSATYDSGYCYTTEPPSLRSGLGARLQDLVLSIFWSYPGALPLLVRMAASIALHPLRARFLPVLFPGDAPVLDIGCGNGQGLIELERYGRSALFGLEPIVGAAEAGFFGPSWSGLQIPEHLHHFTASSLRPIVEAAGFRIMLWRTDSVWLVTKMSLKTWKQSATKGWRALLAALPPLAWLPLTVAADLAGRGQMLRIVATRIDG